MFKNTHSSFGIGSRTFHWLMSFTIIAMLVIGFYMQTLPNDDAKFQLYGMHKATGVVLLVLALLRILWRFINIVPVLPNTMPRWQIYGYKIGVFAMYVFMFAMPLSGLLMSLYSGRDVSVYGLFTIYGMEKNELISSTAYYLHSIAAYAFIVFVSLHSLVALYHHFIDKDRLLMRMLVGK